VLLEGGILLPCGFSSPVLLVFSQRHHTDPRLLRIFHITRPAEHGLRIVLDGFGLAWCLPSRRSVALHVDFCQGITVVPDIDFYTCFFVRPYGCMIIEGEVCGWLWGRGVGEPAFLSKEESKDKDVWQQGLMVELLQ
jgi:hypothetical protein